jgi:amino acid adenylation domain-containing protein
MLERCKSVVRAGRGSTSVIEQSYPLSPLQKGVLFHSLEERGSGVYVDQIFCTLSEAVDVSALRRAWQQIYKRHRILRTSFRWDKLPEPIQEVHHQVEIPFEQLIWRGLTPEEKEKAGLELLASERRHGFDLSQAPITRITLIHYDEHTYQLLWTYHHILVDGRSVLSIMDELFQFYAAYRDKRDLVLPEPRPYRDYIQWLQEQDFSRYENYWRTTLKGFRRPTLLSLPPAHESEHRKHQAFDAEEIKLSTETTSKLNAFVKEHKVSLNTLLQGAWALLLHRYSGEEDIVFGAIRACRHSTVKGGDSMVGLFINTLPMRVRVKPETRVMDCLQELRRQQVELREYEQTPLLQVQGWSEVPRGTPLFESIVVFENTLPDAPLRAKGGEWLNRRFYHVGQSHFPLAFDVCSDAEIGLRIEYDCRRFDAASIKRMLAHLQRLLEGMTANRDRRVADLAMVTATERKQLLVDWNSTERAYASHTLHELFEAQVEETPHAVAVIFETEMLTYRELNHRSNQLAHHLRSIGVGPDMLVGLCLERSLEMVVGLLGILKAGGAYVPLDPGYPKDRLGYMIKDSQMLVLLTQQHLMEQIPELNAQILCLDTDRKVIAEESSFNPISLSRPENLAYVIYTSGSTGNPKGVMIPHRAIVNHMLWMQETFPLSETDRVAQKTPISFDASVWEFYAPLFAGARLVLAPPGGHRDSRYLVKFIAEQEITVLQLVPSLLGIVLDEPEFSACTSLRRVFCGGEALTVGLKEKFQTRLSAELCNLYGPTETTIDATFFRCQRNTKSDAIPIGRPIANTAAFILDAQLEPVSIGLPGELYIGGTGLARGYLNRPELTKEKFISSPFGLQPGARLYKTGDLARYRPDGNIEYLGRIDNQVKLRGLRVELGEIEAVLSQHPKVKQVVVTVREDDPGDHRLIAYVVPEAESLFHVNDLRRYVKEKLPDYMVPSTFVQLDSFPLTPNGKIDGRSLPKPSYEGTRDKPAYMALQTEVENAVAEVWQGVLRRKEIGIHDNFFDLGGHSLLAMQIVSRVRGIFNVDLSFRDLFQTPTVAGLANAIERAKNTRTSNKSQAIPRLVRQAREVNAAKGEGLKP